MPDRPAHRSAGPRRRLDSLPSFALYGEVSAPAPALLHIESIDSRSRKYEWEIDAHVHRGLHQLLWLDSGSVDAMLDESRSRCDGPAALIIPTGVAHAFRFSRHCDGFVLTVNASLLAEGDAADVGDALRVLFAAPRTLALASASPSVARLKTLFEALHAESHAADAADGPVPMWLARAIVWRLAQTARQEVQAAKRGAGGRHSLYTRWVVLLESRYREHWPVSRYADELGLSTERLNRLVRAETGHNAQHLVHGRLAREASRRLVHVAAPVSKLAFDLGFDDPAYFCRFFKRHTGLSPREYRARALQA